MKGLPGRRTGAGRASTPANRRRTQISRTDREHPEHERRGRHSRLSPLPWPVVAALAAVLTAVAGIIPPVALASVGWIQAPDVGLWSVLLLGVRGWLLAHGAGMEGGATTLTIAPLGATAVILLMGSALAAMAGAQARAEAQIELSQRQRRALTVRVAGVFTAAYLVCVLFASALTDTAGQTGRALLGGLVIGGLSGMIGAGRAVDWHPTAWWPAWGRAIPRAVAAALAVMVVTGSAVAMCALLQHRGRVAELHNVLAPGTAGGISLMVLQLTWLPNLVLWCGSWALGAGFSIGSGTLVSPAHNLTGMLPAIPVFGAIGPNGPGPKVALLWLLSGVLAGVIAAVVIVRSRRAARLDETALVGGLSGVLAGLTFWLLAALSNGDLGQTRLVGVGARLVPLAVMAPTVMGISGLVTGLALGLRRELAGRRIEAHHTGAVQPGEDSEEPGPN
ncbi:MULTISPECIES: cell division protein PerM [unclassified Luteococcus]|uniref:cell division protein PerM n=1 Tax=unclassified Luteococcus TaxID=2639923 RepID=UPI00313F0C1A